MSCLVAGRDFIDKEGHWRQVAEIGASGATIAFTLPLAAAENALVEEHSLEVGG